jgi:hypothetical protein
MPITCVGYEVVEVDYVVVAVRVEADAIYVVVDIVAGNSVVAGIVEGDAVPAVVPDVIAGNSVVAGIVEGNAGHVVDDLITGNRVVAGIVEGNADQVVAGSIV